MEPTVTQADGRFVLTMDGEEVGEAAFLDDAGRRIFFHTVVDPSRSGQGLGTRLVTAALDATRDAGMRVVPVCPYVADVAGRHPQHTDLVAAPTAADRRAVAERVGA